MTNAFPAEKEKGTDPRRALFDAAEDGDAARVAQSLSAGAGADARLAPGGETPLMRASARGHEDVARLLLDAGADASARRADGFTPLILAVFFGHERVVRLLVERGADARARTSLGTTARGWAASRGFAGMAGLLRRAEAAQPRAPEPTTAVSAEAGVKSMTRPSDVEEANVFSRGREGRASRAVVTTSPASRRGLPAASDTPAANVPGAKELPSDVAPPDSPSPAAHAAGVSVRRGGQLPAHPSASTFRLGHFLRSWQGSVGTALLLLAFGVAAFALLRGGTAARESARPAPTPLTPQAAAQPPAPPATQPSPAFPTPEALPVVPVTDPAYALPQTAGQPFYIPPVAPGPVQSDAPRDLTVVSENGSASNEQAGRAQRKENGGAGEAAPAQREVRADPGSEASARPAARATRTPEQEQRTAPPAAAPPPAPSQQPTPGRAKVIQWPPQ